MQKADLADVAVEDGRSHIVTDGELVLSSRAKEVARFAAEAGWLFAASDFSCGRTGRRMTSTT